MKQLTKFLDEGEVEEEVKEGLKTRERRLGKDCENVNRFGP